MPDVPVPARQVCRWGGEDNMGMGASLTGSRSSQRGFTLLEMVIVLAIVGIALAIATPSLVTWRNQLYFRQASRNCTTLLRQARSLSMALNRQHYVVFKPYSSAGHGKFASFLIRRSVDPSNMTFANYSCVQSSGTNPAVSLQGTTSSPMANFGFTFNPNGTALFTYPGGSTNDGNVCIYSGTTRKFLINVSITGKITSSQVN
jgi:prepilin-type N-terminal cleavage/methylation domain-containing protein